MYFEVSMKNIRVKEKRRLNSHSLGPSYPGLHGLSSSFLSIISNLWTLRYFYGHLKLDFLEEKSGI